MTGKAYRDHLDDLRLFDVWEEDLVLEEPFLPEELRPDELPILELLAFLVLFLPEEDLLPAPREEDLPEDPEEDLPEELPPEREDEDLPLEL